MANSELLNTTYKLPSDVLQSIQATLVSNPSGEGVKRAKFMLKNGQVTYQVLKRLKNFFDHFNPNSQDKSQYALAGGDLMRSFVERTLNANRDAVSRSKETRRDMTTNPNSELMPYQTPRLTEAEKKEKKKVVKNAIAIIADRDNKILLLKRADEKDTWMPNKWALVGGGVEKGETPQQAVEREILEETGLEIKKFIKSFSLQRNSANSIEYMFVCRYNGDPTLVNLNQENTRYGWFSSGEMEYLDTVPHLLEYITLAFKSYE